MSESRLYHGRWQAVAERLRGDGAEALVVSAGYDLVYLTGYNARPSERLTALIARPDGDGLPTMVLPQLELAHVAGAEHYDVAGWTDDIDPVALVVERLDGASRVVISDELASVHLLRLQQLMPDTTFVSMSQSLGGMRSVKTEAEMQALQTVGGLASEVAAQIQRGEVPLVGRSEKEIAADVIARLEANGHETVEFCIVASGPNSASPHHYPGDRIVQANEIVLFDFGGRHQGYCSDITRCVFTGPIADDVAQAYATLKRAQQAAVDTARAGATLGEVDDAARSIITQDGYGEYFIHRTGHGIGTEVHEQPYVTSGSQRQVQVGNAFSIEPGIYIDGRWGMRLEDIVVVSPDGAVRCSTTDHNLIEVAV